MHTTNPAQGRRLGHAGGAAGAARYAEHASPGAKVGIAVERGRLVVEPQRRRRYILNELLAQCDPRARRSKARAGMAR